MVILDSWLDSAITPPTRLVLVQWLGLAPEDTSLENLLKCRLFDSKSNVSFTVIVAAYPFTVILFHCICPFAFVAKFYNNLLRQMCQIMSPLGRFFK